MKKGIGPNNLGAPKGVGKMYDSPAKKNKPASDPAATDAEMIKRNARLKDNLDRSKGPESDMGPVGKEKQRRRVRQIASPGGALDKATSLGTVKIK